jgi:hypothetical protein
MNRKDALRFLIILVFSAIGVAIVVYLNEKSKWFFKALEQNFQLN